MRLRSFCTAAAMIAVFACYSLGAHAQCSTCPTSYTAYAPVVAQPTVTYTASSGWYPGKLLDRWRLRRYGVATTAATTYTATYAPYTASYAPYTASYVPTTYTTSYVPYTAAYRPYVTAYAPLAAPVSACNTCSYAVARPVALAPACSTCGCDPCGCSPCGTGVSQATYLDSGCSTCAGSSVTTYQNETPQPQMGTEPEPENSIYRSDRPTTGPDPLDDVDPIPADDSSIQLRAPRLYQPGGRTADASSSRGPTTKVWQAVYREAQPTTARGASYHSAKPQTSELVVWESVPRN